MRDDNEQQHAKRDGADALPNAVVEIKRRHNRLDVQAGVGQCSVLSYCCVVPAARQRQSQQTTAQLRDSIWDTAHATKVTRARTHHMMACECAHTARARARTRSRTGGQRAQCQKSKKMKVIGIQG